VENTEPVAKIVNVSAIHVQGSFVGTASWRVNNIMSENGDIEIILPDGSRSLLTGKDAEDLRNFAEKENITLEQAIMKIIRKSLDEYRRS
jgi:hypothetical protein